MLFAFDDSSLKPQFFTSIKSVLGNIITLDMKHNLFHLGQTCFIEGTGLAEVVGFKNNETLIMSYNTTHGIKPGLRVYLQEADQYIYPCEEWRGRVLNGFGNPIDHKNTLKQGQEKISLHPHPLPAYKRKRIHNPLDVGVRAINTFLTCCKGQRMGIFSGSGVGKSMLLSMLARYTEADICVIGLIGERGREVREFLEETLGEEGLKKSVVVVATSDESPLLRRRAAYTTMAIAEYFRDQGQHVLCLMDSITRFALSQKEIALASKEHVSGSNGYPSSVIGELSRLLERAGPGINDGVITGFFSVLVEGDDMNEPIADMVRGILDGHIVMSRNIAERGRFPAIDVLKSVSRMVPQAHTQKEQEIIVKLRSILAQYEDMADIIRLGVYKKGSNEQVDQAIEIYPELDRFLNQNYRDRTSKEDSFTQVRSIAEKITETSTQV
jgi:flagellum-specific ATP synthase